MAAHKAAVRNTAWRVRYHAELLPVKRLDSAMAIEAEYTITMPAAASSNPAHASERSYSASGALRAKT
jgi:hypothetical protein